VSVRLLGGRRERLLQHALHSRIRLLERHAPVPGLSGAAHATPASADVTQSLYVVCQFEGVTEPKAVQPETQLVGAGLLHG